MDAVFLRLLNMSITASWLCLAVLLVRLLLKKAPKAISCALWALVGLRLLFPFSIESALSLVPSAEPLPEDMLLSPNPTINSGIPVINEVVNPVISGSLAPTPGDSVNPMQIITTIAGYVWLVGMAAMLVYMLVTYLRVRGKVTEAVKLEGSVYECDHVDTPFVLGVIRPRIYLPSSMNEADRAFVIAHEQAHLRRLDHVWKPLGFLLLTVYWFNPLLWLGYILLCRDIELACDEKVIRELGSDIKRSYSEALLSCSVHRRTIAACPLAFGEVGVKDRIKSVLNYKKPAFWIILVAVVALVVTGVCFLTDPPASTDNDPADIDHPLYEDLGTSVLHDIDNDGVMDYCTIGPGPTSGVFTFTLTVTDENKSTTKYVNIFDHDPCSLSFVRNESGAVYLRAEDFSPTSQADTHYYDIGIEGSLIVLSENGKKIDSLIPTIQYPYSVWDFTTIPEITLPGLGGTKLVFEKSTYSNHQIKMVDRAGKETMLLAGPTVQKAVFADLNQDGHSELLLQASPAYSYSHKILLVYDIKNGRFYRLEQKDVYDFSLSTEDNTLSVSIFDRENRKYLPTATPVLTQSDGQNVLSLYDGEQVLYVAPDNTASETFQLRIRQDYAAYKGGISVAYLSVYVVASFDDVYAVFMGGYENANTVITYETVGGLTFRYPTSQHMLIYQDGSFYSITDAYQKGILTEESLHSLHTTYMARFSH